MYMVDTLKKEKKRNLNSYEYCFLSCLKNSKFEDAIVNYFHKDILIIYNNKKRLVDKQNWIRYVKRSILNKFTDVIQFKIANIKILNEDMFFDVFMICKKHTGTLFFTEIKIQHKWDNNLIYQTTYELHNY